MKKHEKTIFIGDNCVACGSCMKKCPTKSISIPNGIKAIINHNKCVSCGLCAKTCPAGIIEIREE